MCLTKNSTGWFHGSSCEVFVPCRNFRCSSIWPSPSATRSSAACSRDGSACRPSSAISSPASPWGRSRPGFRGDDTAIRQMAEFGVILLMFGVGLHFSFRDLWQVRRVVDPRRRASAWSSSRSIGALVASQLWGIGAGGAWVLGVALSVTSTVVLMRTLMDQGWLDTPAGKVAVGWLVVEDLLTVAILVLLPTLAGPEAASWGASLLAMGIGAALRRPDDARRRLRRAGAPRPRRAPAIARAVRAGGADAGDRHGAGLVRVLRRVARARRIRRRPRRRRIAVQPSGRRRPAAVPRGVRRHLLRVRRHARGSACCSSRSGTAC